MPALALDNVAHLPLTGGARVGLFVNQLLFLHDLG